jgi:hypothetical protein
MNDIDEINLDEALGHYNKGLKKEEQGDTKGANEEYACAVTITAGKNQIYVDAYERTRSSAK